MAITNAGYSDELSIQAVRDHINELIRMEERAFCEYYQNLFTSTNNLEIVLVLQQMSWKLSRIQVSSLASSFTAKKVRMTLFNSHPNMEPGIDDMNSNFYHKYSGIGYNEICSTCLEVLKGDPHIEKINKTIISLLFRKLLSRLLPLNFDPLPFAW